MMFTLRTADSILVTQGKCGRGQRTSRGDQGNCVGHHQEMGLYIQDNAKLWTVQRK